MTLRQIGFVIVSLSLAACGTKSNRATETTLPIVGTWLAEASADPAVGERTLTISPEALTYRNACVVNDKLVRVEVSSPAIISASHLNVLRDGRESVKTAGGSCTALISRGLLRYQLTEDRLILIAKDGSSTVFNKRAAVKAAPAPAASAVNETPLELTGP